MKLGAVDFLEKPFEDDRLIGMIDIALKQAESGARTEAATHDIAARVASLSPRERQVMEGLVAGLSNKLIARDYDISPRTIEVYRANVILDAGRQPLRTGPPRHASRRDQGLRQIKSPSTNALIWPCRYQNQFGW